MQVECTTTKYLTLSSHFFLYVQGDPDTVNLLLEAGAMVEHVDINGMRALDRAIGCGNIAAVRCFLRKGAKLGPTTWNMANGKPEIM